MSAIQKLLDRLELKKPTRPGHWIARCPAHADRSPSLSIRETDDGYILIHDFGGCSTGDVLAALGLRFSDLFERPVNHSVVPYQSRIPARDLLELVAFEAFVVTIIASDILEHRDTGELGWARLATAAARINYARLQANG